MTKLTHLVWLLLLSFSLLACTDSEKSENKLIKIMGKTMGTQYHISVVISGNKNQALQPHLKNNIDALLVKINQQMSTYIASSEISQFNQYQQTDWFPVSQDFAFVVENAQQVSYKTKGAFDITVAPLIDLWGFGSKAQLNIPTDEQINRTLQQIGFQFLQVRNNPPALRKQNKSLQINLSAVAKGFAVDKISAYLLGGGYHNFLVEIGGEIHNQGFNKDNKPWKIAIETPSQSMTNKNKKVLLSSNISLATSGDYRNYFIKNGVRFSHTINPITGKPINHKLASVTVLDKSVMLADAYATALMVLGETKGEIFTKAHQLRVHMIVREQGGYKAWENISGTAREFTATNCLEGGGCAYIQ